MRRICSFVVLFSVAVFCRSAAAHFLWLETEPADKPAKVNLWFSETCAPGQAELLDKVKQTKTWVALPKGETKSLALEKKISGDTGSWSAAAEITRPCAIEATCDYGVVSRGGETFLLHYAARRAEIKRPEDIGRFGATKALPLDVRIKCEGPALVVSATFQGKPAADAELLAILPNNEEREFKLDAKGTVRIEEPASGDYALRARYVVKTPGDRDGKHYDEARYYSTFTFQLPANTFAAAAVSAEESKPVVAPAANVDAAELLRRTREHRAVWEHFPGFTADVTVQIDDKVEKGKISIDENGSVSTQLKDNKLRDWVDEQIGSLVDHRMPSTSDDEKPVFADDDITHPLGRLIRLGDAKYDSSYRIRDDMVMEVNRRAGAQKFTITVLEVDRNKEGKYLPRTYNATFWDAKSGEIKTSSSYLNTWQRVGRFDLPKLLLEVETNPGERQVKEITFDDYRLNEKSK